MSVGLNSFCSRFGPRNFLRAPSAGPTFFTMISNMGICLVDGSLWCFGGLVGILNQGSMLGHHGMYLGFGGSSRMTFQPHGF